MNSPNELSRMNALLQIAAKRIKPTMKNMLYSRGV
jgi:hypothetical protein